MMFLYFLFFFPLTGKRAPKIGSADICYGREIILSLTNFIANYGLTERREFSLKMNTLFCEEIASKTGGEGVVAFQLGSGDL